MSANILDGKQLSKTMQTRLVQQVEELKARGTPPAITSIRIKGDDASAYYVKSQAKAASQLGIAYNLLELSEKTTQVELIDAIDQLNNDDAVTGIILQVPLPKHIDEDAMHQRIVPWKNIEGMHVENIGEMVRGGDGLVPCTARAAIEFLLSHNIETKGKHAVVLGRSYIVGRPVALMLLSRDATVTVCHRHTPDIKRFCRDADILITAVGAQAGLVTADMVKPGATVIDIAIIPKEGGGITGDVDYETVKDVAGAITPVPGGVGPVTVMMLMRNAIIAAFELNKDSPVGVKEGVVGR